MKDSANGAPPGEFPGDFRNVPLTSAGTPSMRRPSSLSAALSSTTAGPLCVVSLGSWSTSSLVALFRLLAMSKYAVFGRGLGVSSRHTPGYHALAVRLTLHCKCESANQQAQMHTNWRCHEMVDNTCCQLPSWDCVENAIVATLCRQETCLLLV